MPENLSYDEICVAIFPPELLERLDKYAKRIEITREQAIQEAVDEYIENEEAIEEAMRKPRPALCASTPRPVKMGEAGARFFYKLFSEERLRNGVRDDE